MYKVKNLTNSPHRITTADGGFGVLPARGEEDFDIHPRMVQPYSALGYLKLTKIESDSLEPIANPEHLAIDVDDSLKEDASNSNEQDATAIEVVDEDEEMECEEGEDISDRDVTEEVSFTEEADAVAVEAEEDEAPEPSEDEQKESLIAQLKELDIKADKRSSVEKLQEKLDEALAK